MDNRLGQWTEGGAVWPSLTISGQEYSRPATTLSIGDGYFVVIENETTAAIEALLSDIREGLTNERKHEKRSSRKPTASGTSDVSHPALQDDENDTSPAGDSESA